MTDKSNNGEEAKKEVSGVSLKYNADGLIPAIVQDINTKEVLMMAYMNEASLQKTHATGRTWFWSRSRQCYWQKGESSGNTQEVKGIYYDCDADTLLVKVAQKGVACHTGRYSCFYNPLGSVENGAEGVAAGLAVLPELVEVIRERALKKPAGSYVADLIAAGTGAVARKLGEEALELMLAIAEAADDRAGKKDGLTRVKEEAADLLFHLLVSITVAGVSWESVLDELRKRRDGGGSR